ncbi:metallophosphoesterase [Egicoccus sp. AB-alg6-2]|uniref:metallophosphoesterase n=1 Tax=Egicoccus sp. AB-alg6-2 TaxID=3242692 RepID=UPI00359D3DC1
MGRLARTAAAVGGAGVACVAYGTLVERRWYRLRHLPLPGALRRAANTPDGRLRILHVSDVHLVPGQDHRVRFLGSLARLDHDLVVATGDLLGATDAEDLAADALAPLTAGGRPGLVVLGSNDLYGPIPKSPSTYFTRPERRIHGQRLDTDRLTDRLAAYGYRTLHGESLRLETPAGRIGVGGIDDPHLPTTVLPPVAAVTADADDAVLHLGLVHAPYLAALDVLVDAGHDLLLAGHTHGGQVRLPGLGALVANCDLPLQQARGASRYRGRWLHVSPGLGHSRYAPFRFACRPEATLLELSA